MKLKGLKEDDFHWIWDKKLVEEINFVHVNTEIQVEKLFEKRSCWNEMKGVNGNYLDFCVLLHLSMRFCREIMPTSFLHAKLKEETEFSPRKIHI